jgi:hypothetical protein
MSEIQLSSARNEGNKTCTEKETNRRIHKYAPYFPSINALLRPIILQMDRSKELKFIVSFSSNCECNAKRSQEVA